MSHSLYSGLSGLLANQTYLDVIGDNLANSQTVAFKSSRVNFSDILAQTLHGAQGPNGNWGGVNPVQVGRGTRVQTIDPNTTQGVIAATGRPFDLALEGSGFFVLSGGNGSVYTRAGNFGLDASGYVVHGGTGLRVQGTSGDIQIDTQATLPPKASGSITLQGNLPAKVTGPLQEVVWSSNPFETGNPAELLGRETGPFDLDDGSGDAMQMTVRVDDDTVRTVTFDHSEFADPNAATIDEVVAVLQDAVTEADVVNDGGRLKFVSRRNGSVSSLAVEDVRGNASVVLGLPGSDRGTSESATRSVDLSALVSNVENYKNGDAIRLEGTDSSGQSVSGTFVYGTDGTTLGDLADFANSLFQGAEVVVDDDGRIVATAKEAGEAHLSLSLEDGSASRGSTSFDEHAFETSVDGQGPDKVRSAIEVYDTQGRRHTLEAVFVRREGSTWDLQAALPDDDGTFSDATVNGISFGADGSIASIEDSDTQLRVAFEGTGEQTLTLSLGEPGSFDGLTQFGDAETAYASSQDGFGAGDLLSVGVAEDGKVQGFYSNGQRVDMAELSLAFFSNPGALAR